MFANFIIIIEVFILTIREIAHIANVSPATISLVLNNKPGVSETKRQEILQLLNELNYSTTQRKKHPKQVRKDLLFLKFIKTGFLVEENAGFISRIMDSIECECSYYNYALRIQVESKNLETAIRNIDYTSIDGIFVIGTELDTCDYPILEKIQVPYVVIDNSMPNFPCNSITMANEEMVNIAVQHLSTMHPSEVGYIHSLFQAQNFEERAKGFKSAVQRFGLQFNPSGMFLIEPTLSGSYSGMKKYLEKGAHIPGFLFADNDTLAIGCMKALQEFGYKVPEDIKIVGFDDIYLSATCTPPLTTVHVQRTMIGRYAVLLLNDEITTHNPGNIKIRISSSDLIIRKSTC